MIVPFQNILFLKQFACNGCLESKTSFWCTFSASFFHKNVPYLILYQIQCSTLYLFSFSRYQTECVIKAISGVINFKIYLPSSSKPMADREKRGEDENTKIWCLDNEQSFLDEIKNIFCNYSRAVIWWKKKKNSGHKR